MLGEGLGLVGEMVGNGLEAGTAGEGLALEVDMVGNGLKAGIASERLTLEVEMLGESLALEAGMLGDGWNQALDESWNQR